MILEGIALTRCTCLPLYTEKLAQVECRTGREGNWLKDTQRARGASAMPMSTIHKAWDSSLSIFGTHTVAGIVCRPSTCVPKGVFIELDLFGAKITFPHAEFIFLKSREYYLHHQPGKIKRLIISSAGESRWKFICLYIFWGRRTI